MKAGTITTEKYHPIRHLFDGGCFALVEREIGWYPDIYRICDDSSRRVFKHNNCLPCKNMEGRLDSSGASGEFAGVAEHYPVYFAEAQQLSAELGAYWGREKGFNGHCQFCEFSYHPLPSNISDPVKQGIYGFYPTIAIRVFRYCTLLFDNLPILPQNWRGLYC